MKKKRLAIIGSGSLANIIADAYRSKMLEEYEPVCVMGRTESKTVSLADRLGCGAAFTIDDMLDAKPDIIAEAASVQAVKDSVLKIADSGVDFAVLSIGAFANSTFYNQVKERFAKNNAKLYIPAGAIGGLDVMQAISLMGNCSAEFLIRKGVDAYAGTEIFTEDILHIKEETCIFSGTAAEVIKLLPTKVNVAVTTSLATVGADSLKTEIYAVPEMKDDDIQIKLKGEDASAHLQICSKPSDITAWSIVALLKNIVSPVVFY